MYKIIQNTNDYYSAIKALDAAYIKPVNFIYNRHQLLTLRQQPAQTIDAFILQLEVLAKSCNFQAVTAEENKCQYIRDAFISVITSSSIHQCLLKKSSLTLQETYSMTRSLEQVVKHSECYENNNNMMATTISHPEAVHVATIRKNIQQSSACFFCVNPCHLRLLCLLRNAKCKKCKKQKGHWAMVCRAPVTAATLYEPDASLPCLAGFGTKTKDISLTKCKINGYIVNAMVDSGSVRTFVSKNIAKELNLFIIPKQKTTALADPTQHAKIIGETIVDISLENKTHSGVIEEVIKDLLTDIIIGKDILKKYNKVTLKFNGPGAELVIGAVNKNNPFPSLNIPPLPLFLHLSPKTTPIATKSCRYTIADTKFIKEETARMLKEGIIEPSVSPWQAQVLVTSNENHKKRMVVDYSSMINRFTKLDAYPMSNIAKIIEDIVKYNVFSTLDLQSAYNQIPISLEDHKYTAFEVCGKLCQFTHLPFGITNGVSAFQRSINNIVDKEKLSDTFVFMDNVTICVKTQKEHD